MSVISMTGFGRGETIIDGYDLVVEISSVNRRQLDCQMALPRNLLALEARLQTLVRKSLTRGYVKITVTLVKVPALPAASDAETTFWRQRITALRAIAAELGLRDDLSASALLQLGAGGVSSGETTIPETVWPALEQTLQTALAKLLVMRRAEGAAIEADLRLRLASLRRWHAAIRARAPALPGQYHETLRARLAALLAGQAAILDDNALAREVALFADRCDISEELTRLASHFEQFTSLLDAASPAGRPLDFLCQELFREINTIGSKAGDRDISTLVISFKTELEAIREQVQNIE